MDLHSITKGDTDNNRKEIETLLNDYLKCVLEKEVSLIETIFNKNAVMYFSKENKLVELPVFPGLEQFILSTEKDIHANGQISFIETLENAAFGKVEVKSKGLVFTDYFTFVKHENRWLVVSKTFSVSLIK